ncbi:hypothetical protein HMF8227_00749 [Saliniradius amylolyticus]|uniref:Uncharacterized protein n=1 Tax=Saliniradius amylolyticus TaxID=2183582 RepID=A0A2S2E0R5_9ALTE|nr:O-antigen ligase family protein [Saliniradius amylolyticus]AWL11245.1 hypothetical protein HMF8227_00749 [Saliniradius amylolyticus]
MSSSTFFSDPRRSFQERGLVLIWALTLLVDTINGALVLNLGLPSMLSPAYKLGAMFLSLLFLAHYAPKVMAYNSAFILIVCCWALSRLWFGDSSGLFFSLQELFKAYLFFLAFSITSVMRTTSAKTIQLVVAGYLLVLLANVAASYTGVGQFSYGSYGATGFFVGGNVVSGIIVVCASWVIYNAYTKSTFRFLTTTLFFLLLALIMGTKGGILGVLLVGMLTMCFRLNAKSILLFAFLFSVSLGGLLLAWDWLTDTPIYARLVFFYEQGGISRALLSGREEKFAIIFPTLLSGGWQDWVWGLDFEKLSALSETRIELDFADMAIYFGFAITGFIYTSYLAVFLTLTRIKHKAFRAPPIIAFLLLLALGSVAGHVSFNGVITPIWGIFMGLALSSCLNAHDVHRD